MSANEPVLEVPPRRALGLYWKRLIPLLGEQRATHVCQVAAEAIRCHPVPQDELGRLQEHWYESVRTGKPDYDVYRVPVYLAEVWYCWATYSRKYLRQLAELGLLQDARRIIDLGCGTGYSTAALCQMAPSAHVLGTNVLDGSQGKFCQEMARRFGFELRADLTDVQPADALFASEYFEHFPSPITHLRDVLQQSGHPRLLIIANTFTSPSIGHFPSYEVNGVAVDGAQASRAFNATLSKAGYLQRKLKLWNNRPQVWERCSR
jgi:SAM-dependent methyltransferase